jgi:adenylosuccinate lyase
LYKGDSLYHLQSYVSQAIREVPALSAHARASLAAILENFDVREAEKVKKLEATTNHDVKAVEYYM